MLFWMLSAIVFTALVAIAAWCGERALRVAGRPTRGVWMFAVAAGTLWPILVPLLRRLQSSPVSARAGATVLDTVRIAPERLPAGVAWLLLVDHVLMWAWPAVSLLLLLRYVMVWRAVRALRESAEPAVVDGMRVLVSDDVGPAVVGVRDAAVLVPRALLQLDASLRALVLRHEEEHRRARDTWLLLVLALALVVVPWNAPLWWIVRRTQLALEVDCDARVLAGGTNAARYAQVLLLATQRAGAASLTPMLVASRTHLERRIIAMQERIAVNSRGRRALRVAAATAGGVVALAVACSSPIVDQTAPRKTMDAVPARSMGRTPQPVNQEQPYFEFQVEKQAATVPGSPQPEYPASMKAANVEGRVLAQFVVDTTGRVETKTFKVLDTNRQEFADAVRQALPEMRFAPAEIGGLKVKQMVQQPFTFALTK